MTTTTTRKTAELGELVVATFDNAAEYTSDPREVARLATRAVIHMLRCRGYEALQTPTTTAGGHR